MQLGREGGVCFAVCRLEAESEDVAVQWAVAMIRHAIPELRVTRVQSGRYGSIDIR